MLHLMARFDYWEPSLIEHCLLEGMYQFATSTHQEIPVHGDPVRLLGTMLRMYITFIQKRCAEPLNRGLTTIWPISLITGETSSYDDTMRVVWPVAMSGICGVYDRHQIGVGHFCRDPVSHEHGAGVTCQKHAYILPKQQLDSAIQHYKFPPPCEAATGCYIDPFSYEDLNQIELLSPVTQTTFYAKQAKWPYAYPAPEPAPIPAFEPEPAQPLNLTRRLYLPPRPQPGSGPPPPDPANNGPTGYAPTPKIRSNNRAGPYNRTPTRQHKRRKSVARSTKRRTLSKRSRSKARRKSRKVQ
jgi:hypothetical protein